MKVIINGWRHIVTVAQVTSGDRGQVDFNSRMSEAHLQLVLQNAEDLTYRSFERHHHRGLFRAPLVEYIRLGVVQSPSGLCSSTLDGSDDPRGQTTGVATRFPSRAKPTGPDPEAWGEGCHISPAVAVP